MSSEQRVTATGGFAYGTVGADIHVFGDGLPVYVLENRREAPDVSPGFLAELPSRMLNSRFAVVDFTGREAELRELREWRDDRGTRLAARWLHGPGGQGKTRLAQHFAALSAASGWKVVTAVDGPGAVHPPPGSQDMGTDGAAGLLVLVDYAERWPGSHLRWLFSNALFHRPAVPTRILLLGRSAEAWPALRSSLTDLQAATSSRFLEPLAPDDPVRRTEMFETARDCFAALSGLDAPARVPPPAPLDRPEFGLTLTVHMAALVAVDARLRGRRAPEDEAGLSLYLLDREHAHWERLFGDASHLLGEDGRAHRVPPERMNQLVFTAALTGPLDRTTAETALTARELLPPGAPRAQDAPGDELDAHARCYPPADPALDTVLEPLYPDRLAEDFLALTLVGHGADYPAREWAVDTVTRLLERPGSAYPAARWTPRAITFLAAAAERWPHVGPGCLFPLLRRDPGLAVAAGSAGLSALAAVGDADAELLELVEDALPEDRAVDLDAGMADLVARVGRNSLALLEDPADRRRVHHAVGLRLYWAGLYERAGEALELAVTESRLANAREPGSHDLFLASALVDLAECRAALGHGEDALPLSEEAMTLLRRLAGDGAPESQQMLAIVAHNYSALLARLDRWREATPPAREAVASLRTQADDGDTEAEALLASSLNTLAHCLNHLGHYEEAVPVFAEDVALRRRLAARNPTRFEPELAHSLISLASFLAAQRRDGEALPVTREAVAVGRHLSSVNPTAFRPFLAASLTLLANQLTRADRHLEALSAAEESGEVLARLVEGNPRAHEVQWATAQLHLSRCQSDLDRHEDALATVEAALAVFRRLMEEDPARHGARYTGMLVELGLRNSDMDRWETALALFDQALEIFRPWAAGDPLHAAKDLAGLHTKRGNALAALERHAEALEEAREAARILRTAFEQQSAAFAHDLTAVLGILTERLEATGHHEEARRVEKEAQRAAATDLFNARSSDSAAPSSTWYGALHEELVDTSAAPPGPLPVTPEVVESFRSLADDDFPRFGPQLAVLLNDVSVHYAGTGRPEEAVLAARESATLLRELAADDPGAHARDLARALTNLGLWLSDAGRPHEGVEPSTEAVGILRRLTEEDPDAHAPDLTSALINAGTLLSSVGRLDEAAALGAEAAGLLRRLTAQDPVRYEHRFADALGNLGGYLARTDRLAEAVTATEEAVALYRRLAALAPERHEEGLAGYLSNLSRDLSDLGRPTEALVAAEEAVAVARRLAESAPDQHARLVGGALMRLAGRLSRADRDTESVAVTEEAVGWFRRLTARSPRHAVELATALADLGTFRANAGAMEEALEAAAEAGALFRRVPRGDPRLFAVRHGSAMLRVERLLDLWKDEHLALASSATDPALVHALTAGLRPSRVLPVTAWAVQG